MAPGDAVIYLMDPWLHGAGLFDCCLPDGRILVLFTGEREELFQAQELELLDNWIDQLIANTNWHQPLGANA